MKRFARAFKKNPRLGFQVAIDRVKDWFEEYHLGIRTGGLIPIETLIKSWHGNHDYAPTTISAFRAIMNTLNIEGKNDVFIDLGCGKGRVLILAAQYPFKRIIGVEISPALADAARANIAKTARVHSYACRNIEIVNVSADLFAFPEDASVLYLFNPFHGVVLEKVLLNVQNSLLTHPRQMRIIYNNPIHFQRIQGNYPWLRSCRHFSFEHDCIVYESITRN
jgi:SAM-dependent methyltransferase